jgi:hypothetical protein
MTPSDRKFVSYAFEDLDYNTVKNHSRQYEGVDMAKLIGADEDNFPFLIQADDDEYDLMFWNPYNGIMMRIDEDSVRAYAAKQFFKDNAYPIFANYAEAEAYAVSHHWPRKP